MKKLKLLWKILKTTGTDKIIYAFFIFLLCSAFIFTLIEPSIKTYIDGIWYCFAVFTTTGFGDLAAVTLLGRILSIVIGIYGILIVALIPGILVSFYWEILKIKSDDSTMMFLDKLERLPELSKEELAEISETIKNKKRKNKI